jgi:hypothetical protein
MGCASVYPSWTVYVIKHGMSLLVRSVEGGSRREEMRTFAGLSTRIIIECLVNTGMA